MEDTLVELAPHTLVELAPHTLVELAFRPDIENFFLSRISLESPPYPDMSPCMIWKGAVYAGKRKEGKYGMIRPFLNESRRRMKAHRFAYIFYKGLIPNDKMCCHRCDRKLCCNPDHIKLGTHQDNKDDFMERLYKKKCRI